MLLLSCQFLSPTAEEAYQVHPRRRPRRRRHENHGSD
jgi:hypothetical protein